MVLFQNKMCLKMPLSEGKPLTVTQCIGRGRVSVRKACVQASHTHLMSVLKQHPYKRKHTIPFESGAVALTAGL